MLFRTLSIGYSHVWLYVPGRIFITLVELAIDTAVKMSLQASATLLPQLQPAGTRVVFVDFVTAQMLVEATSTQSGGTDGAVALAMAAGNRDRVRDINKRTGRIISVRGGKAQ